MTFAEVIEVVGNYMSIIGPVVTIAAAISATTPNQVDNKIVQFIIDVLNVLGLNVGTAKNAE